MVRQVLEEGGTGGDHNSSGSLMFEQDNSSWSRRSLTLWLVLLAVLFAVLGNLVWFFRMIEMPLKSYAEPLPPLSSEQLEIANHLSGHVTFLSKKIGVRNLSNADTLQASTDYFRSQFALSGCAVKEQTYMVDGQQVRNLEVTLPGSDTTQGEIVVVGAHYDTVQSSPGADDNASGVAAVLELAGQLRKTVHRKTIRLVLFVNEEPPFFQTETMGSLVYAKALKSDRVKVSAMLSLEMLGYYSDTPGSQKYPPLLGLFYPDRGNFICFVGNADSRALLRQAIGKFRETTRFPSEGIAAPEDWPGVGWSDHWSFWQEHYPAIMITDTALFRYSEYHTAFDTPRHLNFQKMACVVEGVRRVIERLAE